MGASSRYSLAWLALCGLTAAGFVFLLAPILVVLIEAFNDASIMRFPPQRLSLRWFREFFANAEFMASLLFSLQLALLSAVISTISGTMAAVALARSRRGTAALETALLAPLYVPRVMVGLSLLLAYAWLNVSGSFVGLLLAHVLITAPYAIRTVLVGLRAVEPATEEAARMLGATPRQTFRLVTLPLIASSVLSGFIFAFIISFSDIYLALFISGSQSITMPLRLFNFMEWDQSPLVAAASAVQIVLILAVVLVSSRLLGLSTVGKLQ
jgi:putative spermidine/putrescine transport system permease protein